MPLATGPTPLGPPCDRLPIYTSHEHQHHSSHRRLQHVCNRFPSMPSLFELFFGVGEPHPANPIAQIGQSCRDLHFKTTHDHDHSRDQCRRQCPTRPRFHPFQLVNGPDFVDRHRPPCSSSSRPSIPTPAALPLVFSSDGRCPPCRTWLTEFASTYPCCVRLPDPVHLPSTK